jgi:formate dehydrogenase major subunit
VPVGSLAAEKGISNGEKVVVESARGQVTAVAIVTRRLVPLRVDGQVIHHVGLPWHWGYMGLVTGDSANLLNRLHVLCSYLPISLPPS